MLLIFYLLLQNGNAYKLPRKQIAKLEEDLKSSIRKTFVSGKNMTAYSTGTI